MSKRNKNQKKQSSTPTNAKEKILKRRWRNIRRTILFSFVLVSVGGVGIAALKHNYSVTHDLSVIGQGKPTVVQIHDPNCQLCQRLRRNAGNAIDRIGDDILFRVADVTTPQGRSLQLKYDVPHVTLLLFDRDGDLRRTLNGVQSDELLHRTFLAHLNHRANRLPDNLSGSIQ